MQEEPSNYTTKDNTNIKYTKIMTFISVSQSTVRYFITFRIDLM